MPKANKRKRALQGAAAVKSKKYRDINQWKDKLTRLRGLEHKVKNPKGRTRSNDENKLIMLAVMGVLECRLNEPGAKHLTWTTIEEEVAVLLCCRQAHVFHVRNYFVNHSELPPIETAARGVGSYKYNRDKISVVTSELLLEIATFVDDTHSKGASVTNKKVRAYLKAKAQVDVSRSSVQRAMKKLGLNWRPTRPRA
jgi:hypothetical protein